MKLEEELKGAKVKMAPDAFRQLVQMAYTELYGEMPDEQLLCMPDEAKRFCGIIRQRTKAPHLADTPILRTMSNLRKRSQLKAIG